MNKYVGIIETYYETGLECIAIIFHSDTGNHEGPKWDNPKETMIYRDLAHSCWFGKKNKYNVKVYSKDGNTIEYEGPLTYNREEIRKRNGNPSFLPNEVDYATFVGWAIQERKMELETDYRIVAAEAKCKDCEQLINGCKCHKQGEV